MKEVPLMSTKLFVGNLPFTLNEDDLRNLFETRGTVTNIHIPTDRITHQSRGFAFIEMDTPEQAQNAIDQFNEAAIGGRDIKVALAVEKEQFSTNRPYAKNIGLGNCILCDINTTLYGFKNTRNTYGVCANCISSLSKASRSSRKY